MVSPWLLARFIPALALTFICSGAVAQPVSIAPITCIRQPALSCIESLKSKLIIDRSSHDDDLKEFDQRDVNGRPYSGPRIIILHGRISGENDRISRVISLWLDKNNFVSSINFDLPADPKSARTNSEYDRTQIYYYLGIILPDSCLDQDRNMVYQFFENKIKPTIGSPRHSTEFGSSYAADKYYYSSRNIIMCGVSISYYSTHGTDTSDISEYNWSGTRFISGITMSTSKPIAKNRKKK